MATLVQSARASGTPVDITVTLPAAPTPGNLLVATGVRWSASSAGKAEPTFTPPGWQAAPSFYLWVNATSYDGGACAYKVVQAGDPAAATFTWSLGGGSAYSNIVVAEYAGSWGAAPYADMRKKSSDGVWDWNVWFPTPIDLPGRRGVFVCAAMIHLATTWDDIGPFGGAAEYTTLYKGDERPSLANIHAYKLDADMAAEYPTPHSTAGIEGIAGALYAFTESDPGGFPPRFW